MNEVLCDGMGLVVIEDLHKIQVICVEIQEILVSNHLVSHSLRILESIGGGDVIWSSIESPIKLKGTRRAGNRSDITLK